MKKQFTCSLVLLTVSLLALPAIADAPLDDELSQAMRLEHDAKRGAKVYKELCAQCHGEDGWGTYSGDFPQLAGQHSSVVIKQLADIRAGNRDNPRMYPVARESVMGGPQAIADVAAYIETMPMTPDPDVGEGKELEKAEKIYMELCSGCHGVNGEGRREKFYPLIQGQHYEYLLRQLIWIRDGKRRNANREMAKIIASMGNEELEMMADYVSRLMPSEKKLLK